MVVCFLAFQDAKESPRKMQKLVTDFLEFAQDSSQNQKLSELGIK